MTTVFIHGAGCTGAVFGAQRAAFPDSLAPDLPGRGTPGASTSIDEFAGFIERHVADRAAGPTILCGHSMGGAVAVACAIRKNVSIAGVVVLGGGLQMPVSERLLDEMSSDFQRASHRLARAFFAEPTPERLDWAASMLLAVGPSQTIADFRACAAFDASSEAREISCPLLTVTGSADRLMPPDMGADLAARVPGGQSRTIPGAGHFALVEAPDAVNQLLRDFVNGITVRP